MYSMSSNKKSFESQQKIYKALRAVIKRKPLSEVTVSDIKDECGISRSTFYRNFKNITEILEVIFEWFYNHYLEERQGKSNQLLYFFEYWYYHRDLVQIISSHNRGIIEECMKRHETDFKPNFYLQDIKYSIWTSLLSNWSLSKKESPAEMEQLTRKILDKSCLSLLLE